MGKQCRSRTVAGVVAVLVPLCVAVAACSGGDGASPGAAETTVPSGAPSTVASDTSSIPTSDVSTSAAPATTVVGTVVGPAGGTVDSDDGLATLTIPPGALAGETAISVVAATVDPGVPGDPVLGYQLSPDGLSFAMPATLAVRLLGDMPLAPVVAISSRGDGPPEGIAADVVVDAGALTASIPLPHFSEVGIYVLANVDVERFQGRSLFARMELEPEEVGLVPGQQFFPVSDACCFTEESESIEAFESFVVALTGVAYPVDKVEIGDFVQLAPERILDAGPTTLVTHTGQTKRGVQLRGNYTCREPGTDRFGASARFVASYTSPVEATREEATLTVVGRAVCAPPEPLELSLDGLLRGVLGDDTAIVLIEEPDGSTRTQPTTTQDLAAAHPVRVDVVGTADGPVALFVEPRVAGGGPPSLDVTCWGTAVGTSEDDLDRVLAELVVGTCPAPEDDSVDIGSPLCAAATPDAAVAGVALAVRADGVLIVSANTRLGADRVLQNVAGLGAISGLTALDVPASQVCSAYLASPDLVRPPTPQVLQCVQARFDDTGRLGSSPASVLLFVRGTGITGAAATLGGVPDGSRSVVFPDSGGWWIEIGVDGPGEYPVERVSVTTAGGIDIDVTAEVVERLGSDRLAATAVGVISPDGSCG